MSRSFSFALGGAALLAAAMTLASPAVRAEDNDKGEKQKDVRIVKIIGGGPRLGAVVEEVEPPARGALVKSVQDNTPAAKAGLKSGDVIVQFDGEGVRSTAQLRRLVEETPTGRPVNIEVNRGSGKETLTATLERGKGARVDVEGDGPWADMVPPRPPEPPEAPEPPDFRNFTFHSHPGGPGGPRKLGIRFQEISGQLAQYFGLSSDEGILVVHVEADSAAAKAGMKAGDVVLKIDGKNVADERDLRRAVDALEPGKDASVTVQRAGKPVDLKVTVSGAKHEPRETT